MTMRSKKNVVIVCMFLCLLTVLLACGQSLSQGTATQSPTPTQVLTMDEHIQNAVLTTVQAVGNGSNVKVSVSDGAVTETEKTGDTITSNANVINLQEECFTLMKTIWTNDIGWHMKSVDIHIQDDLVDKYGNKSIGDIAECKLTSSTEKLFVWDNLNALSAWDVYDYTWILPSLR